MITIISLCVMAVIIVWCIATQKAWAWRRAQKMYGYFEWEYKGETGSSRDYGPMLEIDMVGAISYRQSCGASITFEVYKSSQEQIDEIIDQRYYMEQQQIKRRF